jgi:putative two-component system response regulator
MSTTNEHRALILVIDDAPQNLTLMDELLSDIYAVKVAANGARGLKIAAGQPKPDLILLDVMMPEMDGFEVCQRLKNDPVTQDIPVIFLTAKTQVTDEQQGFALGAVDYITKPISPPLLHARVRTHLTLKSAADFLRDRNLYLEQEVARRSEEVRQRAEEARIAREMTMMALASIAETRDNETGNHILRTQHYVRALARHVRNRPRFAHLLDDAGIDLVFKASPLHDIGKVGIPDRILLKPGKLTAEEFEIMKTHTTLGHDAIVKAQERVGGHVAILDMAKEIALSHQEKWDGSGYPEGLAGEKIPLSARLMAIADVYDALISRRIYKEPMSHEQARELMIAGRAQHFDPDLLDGFLAIQSEFLTIAHSYTDDEAHMQALRARFETVVNDRATKPAQAA